MFWIDLANPIQKLNLALFQFAFGLEVGATRPLKVSLWLPEQAPVGRFFADYPRLGCAFMILLAALCGYQGPIVANPFESQEITIASICSEIGKPATTC